MKIEMKNNNEKQKPVFTANTLQFKEFEIQSKHVFWN